MIGLEYPSPRCPLLTSFEAGKILKFVTQYVHKYFFEKLFDLIIVFHGR